MPRKRSKEPKTPQITSQSVALRESNGGWLQSGNPGNAGGTGRPPNELRARMRKHLDEELIQACLDDWKNNKLSALQVGEFFARYAIPLQSEKLDMDEGRGVIMRTLGAFVDAAIEDGIPTEQVKRWYDKGIAGLKE